MDRSDTPGATPCSAFQIGQATRQWSSRDFAFGSWSTRVFGDHVREHQHEMAHVMFACAGAYRSSIQGVDQARHRILYHPEHTAHNDRFEAPGLFFSVNFRRPPEEIFEVECPGMSSLADSKRARCLVGQLMRMAEPATADEQLDVECRVAELMQEFSGDRLDEEHPPWLRQVVEVLREPAPPMRMADLARQVNVHPFHMAAIFRRTYRCTPSEFARNVRIDRALKGLFSGNTPLADVAAEHGFSDQSHLTRGITAIFGIGPAELRRRVS